MPYIRVGWENSGDIQIYYEDHGAGPPVVLVHGYLADGHSWEKQELALLAAGYRVITYDRRGGGASSRPGTGYDYGTLSADLNMLLGELDLRQAVLVGCGTGTGDVIRHLGLNGQGRVRAAVLLAPLPPLLPRPADEQDGPGRCFLDDFPGQLAADRPAAIKAYLDTYYSLDVPGAVRVSEQAWYDSFHRAISVSAAAALAGATSFREDFRRDLARITVPVLIVQGTLDMVMPPVAANQLAVILTSSRLIAIPGGPHAIIWTNSAEVNHAILGFLADL